MRQPAISAPGSRSGTGTDCDAAARARRGGPRPAPVWYGLQVDGHLALHERVDQADVRVGARLPNDTLLRSGVPESPSEEPRVQEPVAVVRPGIERGAGGAARSGTRPAGRTPARSFWAIWSTYWSWPFVGPNVNVWTSVELGGICSVGVPPMYDGGREEPEQAAPPACRCRPGSCSAGRSARLSRLTCYRPRQLLLRRLLVLLPRRDRLALLHDLDRALMPGWTVHTYVKCRSSGTSACRSGGAPSSGRPELMSCPACSLAALRLRRQRVH